MSHKLQSFELQAEEGRRGSDASESNGCCFDAAIVQQLVSMGAWQAMQHLSAPSWEKSAKVMRYLASQHEPHWCVYQRTISLLLEKKKSGTRRRRSQRTEFSGLQRREERSEGLSTASIFDPASLWQQELVQSEQTRKSHVARTRKHAGKVSYVAEFHGQAGAVPENLKKLSEKNLQARVEIEKQRWRKNGKQMKEEAGHETKLEVEIQKLQAGDPSASRWERIRQGSSLQSSKVSSTGYFMYHTSQLQRPQCTRHAKCPEEGNQPPGGWGRRLGRGTQKVSELCNGPPAPGGRSEWFPATSVLDPVLVPTNGAGEGQRG